MKRATNWLADRPLMTCMAVIFILSGVFWWQDHEGDRDTAELAECAQDYVEASNAANVPIRQAASELDMADDRLWHAAQLIFTQQADQQDYQELKLAVIARNQLSEELAEARDDNPPPDPPETFCAER